MEFWAKRMNPVRVRTEGREFDKNKQQKPITLLKAGWTNQPEKKSDVLTPGAVLLYLEVSLCFHVLEFFFFFK